MEIDVAGIVRNQAGEVPWSEQGLIRNRRLMAAISRGVEMQEILQVRCPGTGCLDDALRAVHLRDLAEFREQPKYRVICFTFAEDARLDKKLIPCLQYCRLLLQPGGLIALLLPGPPGENWYHHLFAFMSFGRGVSRRCPHWSLLAGAGFVDIRKQVRPGCGRVVTGRRPFAFQRCTRR
ncbi:MAG TPA: hypothetical protein ENK96_01890 [Desulfobulbaceae bacterium]|nr:hypothetical protein [Desulfobulbaceae bacterium]